MIISKFSTLHEFTGSIVNSRWFQRFVIATIILAVVLAGIETDADMMPHTVPC